MPLTYDYWRGGRCRQWWWRRWWARRRQWGRYIHTSRTWNKMTKSLFCKAVAVQECLVYKEQLILIRNTGLCITSSTTSNLAWLMKRNRERGPRINSRTTQGEEEYFFSHNSQRSACSRMGILPHWSNCTIFTALKTRSERIFCCSKIFETPSPMLSQQSHKSLIHRHRSHTCKRSKAAMAVMSCACAAVSTAASKCVKVHMRGRLQKSWKKKGMKIGRNWHGIWSAYAPQSTRKWKLENGMRWEHWKMEWKIGMASVAHRTIQLIIPKLPTASRQEYPAN